MREVLSEALCQRCFVHFLRHALDYLPRKADADSSEAMQLSGGTLTRH
ncbi:MAG: transposase [Acidobacteriaceae bacterium]|nr:transposase [Acidobacteriaceae bacterium]